MNHTIFREGCSFVGVVVDFSWTEIVARNNWNQKIKLESNISQSCSCFEVKVEALDNAIALFLYNQFGYKFGYNNLLKSFNLYLIRTSLFWLGLLQLSLGHPKFKLHSFFCKNVLQLGIVNFEGEHDLMCIHKNLRVICK